MNLFSILLLLGALFSTSSASPICMICDPSVGLPNTWHGTQMLLKAGCSKLGVAEAPCNGMVDNADLTASFDKMYPYLVTLMNIGCKKYCVA